MASVKANAMEHLFRPAGEIVSEVLREGVDDRPIPKLPKPSCMARTANKKKARLCGRRIQWTWTWTLYEHTITPANLIKAENGMST